MPAKTFYHYDTSVSGYGKLDEGTAPTTADTLTRASWTVNGLTGLNFFTEDQAVYGSTVTMADGDNVAAGAPNGSNGLRTLNTLTGTFVAGVWTFNVRVIGGGAISSAIIRFRFRIYKSSNANGTGATELTSGGIQTGGTQYKTTGTDLTGSTGSIGPFTLNAEYLFVTLSWRITDSTNDSTGLSRLQVGSTTSLVTPSFNTTFNDTLSEPVAASDLFSSTWISVPFLNEPISLLWGTTNLIWTYTTGLWGGCTAEQYGTALNTAPCLITEAASPSDSLVVAATYPNTISESTTATDSYVPGLILTKTILESISAVDTYVVVVDFYPSIIESLLNYWGTAGMLWGTTDGVWGGTSAVDSISTTQIFANSFTEAANTADVYNAVQIFVSSLTESRTVTDSFTASLVMNTVLSELGSATDLLSSVYIINCFYNEPDLLVWGISGASWGNVTRHWGDHGATDDLGSNQIFFCPTTESVNALDTVTGVLVIPVSLNEIQNASDSYFPNLVIPVSLLESGGVIDSLTSIQVFTCFLFEAGNIQDQLTFTATGSIANILIAQRDLLIVNTVDLNDSLGIDISCFPDMDPLGVLISGFSGLEQRIARRLTNPRGAWFWAPGECSDIRQYLNDIITAELMITIKNEVEREVLQEEAVRAVTANVTFDSIKLALNISVSGVTIQGPFDFVFNVTSSKLTILN